MAPPRNIVNLKGVAKGYGSRSVLRDITLGVAAGDRIGVVGANGDGKSTLLRLISGVETPDEGLITRVGDLHAVLLGQGDELDDARTIREELVGSRADHEWAADATFRSVLDGLLGGVALSRFPAGMDTAIAPLSGGERRRIALAKLLLDSPQLLLLDEPTNHLDVEGVAWLAAHLAARRGSMLVVTHDRWFLDAVCTATWEVADGAIHQYEGGYAAYVLARAERDRQESARDARRRQLLRKELAWLRRGPPARTSKPKFRIEAANALIADEPEPRDHTELLRFATRRLGTKVLEAEDASVSFGDKQVLRGVTWRLGPGDRVALVGVNGSGKTTLLKLLGGELEPTSGRVDRGATVRMAHLSQDTAEIPGHLRVLESLEAVRAVATLSDGVQITAALLCDRFGFRGDKARTLVRDLSGGERRRLGLMRLLMTEPNVLLLDEPTNDLDIDTLTALEDLLDAFPATIAIVSHDRYFVERVCDDVYALTPEGEIRHLPGGIEQYLQARAAQAGGAGANGAARGSAANATARAAGANRAARAPARAPAPAVSAAKPATFAARPAAPAAKTAVSAAKPAAPAGAVLRAARKEVARLEREIDKLAAHEGELHEAMAAAATDHVRLRELQAELAEITTEREALEAAWMQSAEALER
ncbi:MAG TPA: ABC-F family ATP-binding cassette domain-containing protein [Solirubrobacteraceae bacterium]|nr:ABC-F family ATP-binding cassette domain-containing protein [Solirubrobacteraceae bacterium]